MPIKRKKPHKSSMMSIPAHLLPAKAYEGRDGRVYLGRDITTHCIIVGEVALELLNRMPNNLRSKLFPDGSHLVASVHDVGKCSPTFIRKLVNVARETVNQEDPLFQITADNPSLEKQWGGHAGVSQVALSHLNVGKFIPEIAGQHHGFNPPVEAYLANDAVFGGAEWQQERESLVVQLREHFQSDFPKIENDPQARALAGLTCVADWIGSGKHFENPNEDWRPLIKKAVDDAGFIRPTIKKGMVFKDLFGFDQPREAQSLLIRNGYKPGVHIMEAPMGLGKTEAALYCAYLAMSELDAPGVYFALPTQLTSNAIYRRFNAFLSNIIEGDVDSFLLHGSAWLVDRVEMGAAARPGGSWFDSKKRGLLAPFAVGTVDQALMAAMNVKHGFVRAFGLAGKVVILDEVHTYDAYTGSILDSLVSLLSSLGCTVIVLSATLSASRRDALLGKETSSQAYPLVCSDVFNEHLEVTGMTMELTHQIATRLLSDEGKAVTEVISRASQGQQVLWVENTVGEAQEKYRELALLADSLDIELGLIHSKFTQQDRSEREEHWVSQFGKSGHRTRGEKGRILVGTQVLEQSLDIDADFLVTRFCPTDMLLQRFGRLWRHKDTHRQPDALCEAWIIAPKKSDIDARPSEAFGNSGFVYSPYVLVRTYEVWETRRAVSLPDDIRTLIEDTYSDRTDTGVVATLHNDLMKGTRTRKGVDALRNFASIALAKNGKTLPEEMAQTRYSEVQDTPVLLIKGFKVDRAKGFTEITLLDNRVIQVPINRASVSHAELRSVSAILARQIIGVLPGRSPKPRSVSEMRALGFSNCMYVGKDADQPSNMSLAFVTDSGFISNSPEKKDIFYDKELGFRAVKNSRKH